jgi:hypothetical protein
MKLPMRRPSVYVRAVLIIEVRDCLLPAGTGSFMPRTGLPSSVGWKRDSGVRRWTSVSMPAILRSFTCSSTEYSAWFLPSSSTTCVAATCFVVSR